MDIRLTINTGSVIYHPIQTFPWIYRQINVLQCTSFDIYLAWVCINIIISIMAL